MEYKHKLNMLEPGTILLAIAGILFFILFIFLLVEQHQDRRMYLDAKKNDPEIK